MPNLSLLQKSHRGMKIPTQTMPFYIVQFKLFLSFSRLLIFFSYLCNLFPQDVILVPKSFPSLQIAPCSCKELLFKIIANLPYYFYRKRSLSYSQRIAFPPIDCFTFFLLLSSFSLSPSRSYAHRFFRQSTLC
jgi:hypothetical protein